MSDNSVPHPLYHTIISRNVLGGAGDALIRGVCASGFRMRRRIIASDPS